MMKLLRYILFKCIFFIFLGDSIDAIDEKSDGSSNLNTNLAYESILKEYEQLIQKYPDKKELSYNVGNINYLNGDSEAALKNYKKSLITSDPILKASTLYNMGNTYYKMGDYENSIKLYKESLSLNSNDKDAQYNYELSKKMLAQTPPEKNQENNKEQDKSEDSESEDSESEDSESEDSENEDSESESADEKQQEKNQSEKKDNNEEQNNNDKSSKENQESQSLEDDNKNNSEKSDSESPKEEGAQKDQKPEEKRKQEENKLLGKKEAEAILNALKADEKNLKYKKYNTPYKESKLEKDW